MRYFIYVLLSALILFSCRGIFHKKTSMPSTSKGNNEWTSANPPPIVIAQRQDQLLDTTPTAISTPPELMNEPIKEIYFHIWYQPKYTEEEKNRIMSEYKYCFSKDQHRENPPKSCKYFKVRKNFIS